jgi:hypothetical protein
MDWAKIGNFFYRKVHVAMKESLNRHGSRLLPNHSHLPEPIHFSLLPTFKEACCLCLGYFITGVIFYYNPETYATREQLSCVPALLKST